MHDTKLATGKWSFEIRNNAVDPGQGNAWTAFNQYAGLGLVKVGSQSMRGHREEVSDRKQVMGITLEISKLRFP